MPLNARQERFAQELAGGDKLQHEAYAAAGYNEHSGNAARLRAEEPLIKRVTELQEQRAQRLDKTVEGHLTRLMDRADKATAEKNHGAAVRCEELFGKVLGFYVDRLKLEETQTDAQLAEALAPMLSELQGISLEAAAELVLAHLEGREVSPSGNTPDAG